MPFSRLCNSIEKFLCIHVARDGILSASKFEFCPLGGQRRVTLFGRHGVVSTFSVFGWLSGCALFLCLLWGGWYISSGTLLENQIANFCHISLRSSKEGYNLLIKFLFLSYATTFSVISKKELFPDWIYINTVLVWLLYNYNF